MAFWCLDAFVHCARNNFSTGLHLLPRWRWAGSPKSITLYGRGGWGVTRANLESIIGKLGFAQSHVFAKFARFKMRPIYGKYFAKKILLRLIKELSMCSNIGGCMLLYLPPIVITWGSVKNMTIFTDDACGDGRGHLGALLIDTAISQGGFSGVYGGMFHGPAPIAMLVVPSGTACIYGLWLTAVALKVLEVNDS